MSVIMYCSGLVTELAYYIKVYDRKVLQVPIIVFCYHAEILILQLM